MYFDYQVPNHRPPGSFLADIDNLSLTRPWEPISRGTHKTARVSPPNQIPPREAWPFVECSPHRGDLCARARNPEARRRRLTMPHSLNGAYRNSSCQVL